LNEIIPRPFPTYRNCISSRKASESFGSSKRRESFLRFPQQ
jgi:hypothetical protein